MATAAAGGSPGSTGMAMASEMDPEETEYLAHLACPTIADDSLAHQGVSDVGQGGRKCCDGLRRTPGMVRGFVLPVRDDDDAELILHDEQITVGLLPASEHLRDRFRVHRRFSVFFFLHTRAPIYLIALVQQITDTHT